MWRAPYTNINKNDNTPQHKQHKCEISYYGDQTKWEAINSDKYILSPVVGDFLYFTRAVDPTIMVELGALATSQPT